ncbi:MAG: RNA ligase family protein [Myxococcales bacterium]|nr:RNA ligase family protein [Myxococcales bacterium]
MACLNRYPRTCHLPFSPGATRDDRMIEDGGSSLLDIPVVLTEKMDGSNVILRRGGVHPRARWHESMNPLRALHARIGRCIPEQLDLAGEWLFAVHSIRYRALQAWYQVFGVFDAGREVFLGWDEVERTARSLGLHTVPVLARDVRFANMALLRSHVEALMRTSSSQGGDREGVVVRAAREISPAEFGAMVGKYVRAGHVAEGVEHWSVGPWTRNELATSDKAGGSR